MALIRESVPLVSLFSLIEEEAPAAPQQANVPSLLEPRPGLEADSQWWQALLLAAFTEDGEAAEGVYGALHGVRCCGARLTLGATGTGLRIVDGNLYDGNWAADRIRWLLPHREAITRLLRQALPPPAEAAAAGEWPPR